VTKARYGNLLTEKREVPANKTAKETGKVCHRGNSRTGKKGFASSGTNLGLKRSQKGKQHTRNEEKKRVGGRVAGPMVLSTDARVIWSRGDGKNFYWRGGRFG